MALEPTDAFPAQLRRHRLLAGLSQEALAERAGLSVRGISDLERGIRRAPHLATITRLADALGLEPAARERLLAAGTRWALPQPAEAAASQAVIDSPPEAPIVEGAGTPPAGRAEERRWVSAVAVQLDGFAGLARSLDPEDLHDAVQAYVECVSEQIRRFDGTVVQASGAVVLAVFGAPAAHEDDAERAVRAGLAIRDCQLPIPSGARVSRLGVRVGIETGEVLAMSQGTEARPSFAVSGAVVSLALSLAGSSAEASVLVGGQTHHATSERVRYRRMEPVHAQDWPAPIAAWEALDVLAAPHARVLGDVPFVGRTHELDVLTGALTGVLREQRPHLVSVLGEPGIGKSRLIAEFERRALAPNQVKPLHGRCLPYGEVVGYRALAAALYQAAGITPDDPAEVARARLAALVTSTLSAPLPDQDARELDRHVALVCGLDTVDDHGGSQPDERSIHVSLRRFLEALARDQPVCLLIDDIHWADQALLSVLEHVAERARAVPLMIVTQARPELLDKRPTWGGGIRAFTSLLLEPLGWDAGLVLAGRLCHDRGLSPTSAQRISRMAGGNPLFAEELCAAMAEGSEASGVPSALRALISARLDALPADERRALQYAAVFGKHVWQAGLAWLGVVSDLFEQLEALERRDLLRLQPSSRFRGQREYTFKHDLIQETAYSLLSRAERRRAHARILEWMEETAGERSEEILDLLAHHAISAELHERALDYLAQAAKRAGRAAAHSEAAALLEQAIGTAERCGRRDLLPLLHAQRGRALARLTRWSDARQELETALALLPAGPTAARAEVLVDLALVSNWNLDTPVLRRYATEAIALASSVSRSDLAMDARFWLAWATGSEGDVASAIDQYQTAVIRTNALGIAPAPSVLPLYATTLCWAGRFPLAVQRGREAVRVAREAANTDSTILAMQVLGLALAGTGAYDDAAQVFAEAARFGRDYGIGPFLARSIAMSAGFHLDVFDFPGHLAVAEEACELARSVNFMPPLISATIDKLLNMARTGQVAIAEQLERDIAGAVDRAGAWHAWLWAVRMAEARAEIALARGDGETAVGLAEVAFQQARGRRPRYEVLALLTHAAALGSLGRTRAGLRDLRQAVAGARAIADPALFVRAAAALLAIDGDDALAAEARTATRHIVDRLPTDEMRAHFNASEPVRTLAGLVARSAPGTPDSSG
jgi:class 3 adenylate cyclase/tetratricopeptide (TPR) repeat protein